MRTVDFSDITLKLAAEQGKALSFRKTLELAGMLDRLRVSVIEMAPVTEPRTGALLIRSVASAVRESTVAVPVDPADPESPAFIWNALKEAAHPRLQVMLPVSTVQMEYFYHKKAETMLLLITKAVSACAALCRDTEFIAADAGRADAGFLSEAIRAAVDAGAKTVTVSDPSGTVLPEECRAAVWRVRGELPEDVRLGVRVSDELRMADACTVGAIAGGADEVKTAVFGTGAASLAVTAEVLRVRGESLGVESGIRVTEIRRDAERVRELIETGRTHTTAFENGTGTAVGTEGVLNAQDDIEAVTRAAEKLGYELAGEDAAKVYEAFSRIARRKQQVGLRELDAIIASAAMQVPPAYRIESYLINSGNVITATAHIRLVRDGKVLEGLSVGDGPVDAAFLAIEQILGCHYELDDFQIRSVTEGREAMGEAVVRLRSRGKVYSGRGISTDIIGSSIHAYINAVNKIVYEEAEA